MTELKNKTELAWEKLFDQHEILSKIQSEGSFQISSREINQVREARLMAKFDQSSLLPEIFRKNKLSILPVTRGDYIIGPFSTHINISYSSQKPIPVEIPNLQTLDYTNLYSEASALLFAYNSGIIRDIMDGKEVNFTVNGRMSSGCFDYNIDTVLPVSSSQKISVQNAQVEVDAGYESPGMFCICEAKNVAVKELLIRQLYYPYRLWRSKISKPIIPVFLVFSNDIFHAFIYQFKDEKKYNSIELVNYKTYTFDDETILQSEVERIWSAIIPEPEPKDIPFPQADSFERVVDLLSVLFEGNLSRDEVTLKYEFDARQTNYYISACEYLGLIERGSNDNEEIEYKLSLEAKKILNLRHKQKYLNLMQRILRHSVFYYTFKKALDLGNIPQKSDILAIMENSSLDLSRITLERRCSTVRGWLDWIFRQCD